MGHKISTIHDYPSISPKTKPQILETRSIKSLSPPHAGKKSSFMQKMKELIHSKKKPQPDCNKVLKHENSQFTCKILEVDEFSKQQKLKQLQININNNREFNTFKRKSSFFDHLGISPTMSPHSPKSSKRNSQNLKRFSINDTGDTNLKENEIKGNKEEKQKIKTSKIRIQKSVSIDETKMGFQPFQSPLIRTSKFLKMPVSDDAALLVSNFSDYLNSVKEKKQIIYSEFIGNEKSMKHFLSNVLFFFKL